MPDDGLTNFAPGEPIIQSEFGQGVVLEAAYDGYLRAFFGAGERRVKWPLSPDNYSKSLR